MNHSNPLVEFRTVRGHPHVFFFREKSAGVNFTTLCYDCGFNASQIAQKLGISSGTMRKSFQEYAGMPPKQWMAQQRVLLSMRMIREGASLSEVAGKMAYHDYSHMAKEFKSVVEFTPKKMKTRLHALQEST